MNRTRFSYHSMVFLFCCAAFLPASSGKSAELSRGEQAVQNAAQQDRYAFVMFYRQNDATTREMHQTVQSTLATRDDATLVPVSVDDSQEKALITRFDATRLPLPAVAVIAPNGAVTTVFPQKVSSQNLTNAIVSKGQAACLKALQDRKIVVLCVQPQAQQTVPAGVQQFKADPLYKDRTEVVTLLATDFSEARFVNQLNLPTNHSQTVIAFMAPPGVMLGTYSSDVTFSTLAQRLAEAGKCCEDPNCKHHQ